MMTPCRAALGCFLTMFAFTMTGCGGADLPELGIVTGKVTMNGKPVRGIYVMATPESGRPAYGTVGADGTYTLKYKNDVEGATVGNNKITLTWPQGGGGPGIPAEYASYDFEIVSGKSEFDIIMTSDEKAWKDFDPEKSGQPAD